MNFLSLTIGLIVYLFGGLKGQLRAFSTCEFRENYVQPMKSDSLYPGYDDDVPLFDCPA
jgi:hypothetical protein